MGMDGRMFSKGEIILREGAEGRSMYEVTKGVVGIYANFGLPQEHKVTELGEGELFAAQSMLEGIPFQAMAVSLVDGTQVREIATDTMYDYIKQEPATVRKMMRSLSFQLRLITQDYEEATKKLAKKAEESPEQEEYSEAGARIESYRRGQIIFREGEPGECMYYLDDGRVGIFTGYGTDAQQMIVELSSESFFGEMGMLEKLPRSATAVALEDNTRLERIEEGNLSEMIEKSPAMTYVALQHLSTRLKDMTEQNQKAQKALIALGQQ